MPVAAMLTDDQVERYSRQILLPGIGGRGQERLLAAAVALFGAAPATEAAAVYLAAAGVGRLTLVGERAAGELVALSALNPDSRVATISPDPRRIREVVDTADLLLSGELDRETRTLLNAACVGARRPLVWGRVEGCVGHVSTVCSGAGDAPCLACLSVPDSPLRADDPARDALADLAAAFVGIQQAMEAMRLLVGRPALVGRLLTYAALDGTIAEVPVARDPTCAACSTSLSQAPPVEP